MPKFADCPLHRRTRRRYPVASLCLVERRSVPAPVVSSLLVVTVIAVLGCTSSPRGRVDSDDALAEETAAVTPTTTPPPAIDTENVLPLSAADAAMLKRYQEILDSRFVNWFHDGSLLLSTRAGNLRQLHRVGGPGGSPELLTRGDDPVAGGRILPDDTIVFGRGRGGNESYQIYRVDPKTGVETLLTDGVSRNLLQEPTPDGRQIAFTSTRRNGRDADLYLLDLAAGGEPRLLLEVDRQTWSLQDWSLDGRRAVLMRYVSRNESYGAILDVESGISTPLPPEAADLAEGVKVSRAGFQFGPGGDTLFFVSDARGEYRELVRLDLKSGRADWITSEIDWDIERFVVSKDRRRAVFAANVDGYSRLYLLDGLDGQPSYRPLSLPKAIVGTVRFSDDGARLGLTLSQESRPSEVFTIEIDSERTTQWTKSDRAGFEDGDFVVPRLIHYPSFDERRVPAFLYLPPNAGDRDSGSLPVVVTIHGGPESQYRPWFSRSRMFYPRELGVAVIAPNVRGSTGYGKTYSLLDNGMGREDSVKDIGALLDWIASEGKTRFGLDPSRVAVSGGSYGGYMVLASLVNFGDRIRAGVDSVGISDFTTFLENTSAYRRHLRREEYGDERDPAMRKFFEQISPARRIGALRSALLLIHGKNDPRVPFSETVQIVKRARQTGQSVWTLYAANEGHGFSRRENRDYRDVVTVRFFREFLLE